MLFRYTVIICILLLLTACSRGRTDSESSKDAQNAPETAAPEVVEPTHALPPGDGAFVRNGDVFKSINAGDNAWLLPTNADRGFGFGYPAGTVVSSKTREFTIQAPQIHPDMLQITRFSGVAASTEHWTDEVSNANVAWIAEAHIPTEVEIIQSDKGTTDIHLTEDLEPGFYVIHDDTMMRGRRNEDVTAYYPFIVHKGGSEIWTHKAEGCFKSQFEKYGALLPMTAPDDIKAIQTCAQTVRIALKAARDDEKSIQTNQLRLIWLSRLALPNDPVIASAMRLHMSKDSDGLAHDLWQTVQSDDLNMLSQLYAASKSKQPLDKDFVRQIVADNMPGSETTSVLALSWMVFVTPKASENEQIQDLFEKISSGEDYQTDLLAMIGGIHWRRMMDLASTQRSLSPYIQKLKANVDEHFVSAAASLQANKSRDKVFLGPFGFENIPDEEISAWRATLMDKKRDIESCLGQSNIRDNATLILEQPLNGSIIGSEKPGTLRDPIDKLRSLPVIPPETVNCILKAFGSLPFNPSLDNDQSVKMAITVLK